MISPEVIYRMIYALGPILYIIYWYVGINYLGLIDPLGMRLLVIIFCLIIFVLSFVSETIIDNYPQITKFLLYLINLHFIILLNINDFSLASVLYYFVILGFDIIIRPYAFIRTRSYNHFFLLSAIAFTISLILTDTKIEVKLTFFIIIGMFLSMLYLVTIRDLYIQKELNFMSDRYEFLINNSDVVLFSIDNEGIFRLSRGKGLQTLGLDQDEVVGFPYYEIYKDYPSILTRVRQALNGQATRSFVHVNDATFDVIYSPYMIGGKQEGIIGLGIEVTELYQTIKKLEATEELLIRNQKLEAVGRLASSIAHDFNNLLSVIELNNELIKYGIEHQNFEDLHNQADQISQNVDKAAYLTRRMLNLSKSRISQPNVIAIDQILKEQEDVIRSALKDNIQLEIRYPEQSCYTIIDPGQLVQIFLNLVLNAQDAIGTNTDGKISITVCESDSPDPYHDTETYHKLIIFDNGHGMDDATQQQIFQPFFTTKEEGSGLGLYSISNILEEVQGEIEIKSELGTGSWFYIYLPKAIPDLSITDDDEDEVTLIEELNQKNIMLVEDNQPLRYTLEHILNNLGLTTTALGNGKNAVAKLNEGFEIDLLISDIILPELDGIELSEIAMQLNSDLKVIYISGYTEGLEAEQINRDNCAFIAKPFTRRDLIREINRLFKDDNP